MCYLLAVANVAAYGTLVRVAVGQGEGAAAELLSAVGLNTVAVAEQVGAVLPYCRTAFSRWCQGHL